MLAIYRSVAADVTAVAAAAAAVAPTYLVHARVQSHRGCLAVGVNVVVCGHKVNPCVIVRHHEAIKAPCITENAVEELGVGAGRLAVDGVVPDVWRGV